MKTFKIIENRRLHYTISAAIVLIALAFTVINGLRGEGMFNYDVEFTGGTSMHIDLKQEERSRDDVTGIVYDVTGETARIQRIIGSTEVIIKMKSITSEQRTALVEALRDAYPGIEEDGIQTVDVSSTISGEMQRKTLLAVFITLGAMFIYISLRFRDAKVGGSAIINQLLNGVIVLCIYAVCRVPLSETFITVMLTVLGYSVNSTIVVLDRVRENKRLLNKKENGELINISITQTFRRSLFTTLTTVFAVVCLLIFGAQSIREFALPIMIGIIFGAYSSVCVAGSLLFSLTGESKTA